MAFHAARLVAQTGQFQTGREDHAVMLDGGIVVAGGAFDGCADRRGRFNCAELAAIRAHEGNVTWGAVALGAIRRDLRWISLIPVPESISFGVIVG